MSVYLYHSVVAGTILFFPKTNNNVNGPELSSFGVHFPLQCITVESLHLNTKTAPS